MCGQILHVYKLSQFLFQIWWGRLIMLFCCWACIRHIDSIWILCGSTAFIHSLLSTLFPLSNFHHLFFSLPPNQPVSISRGVQFSRTSIMWHCHYRTHLQGLSFHMYSTKFNLNLQLPSLCCVPISDMWWAFKLSWLTWHVFEI